MIQFSKWFHTISIWLKVQLGSWQTEYLQCFIILKKKTSKIRLNQIKIIWNINSNMSAIESIVWLPPYKYEIANKIHLNLQNRIPFIWRHQSKNGYTEYAKLNSTEAKKMILSNIHKLTDDCSANAMKLQIKFHQKRSYSTQARAHTLFKSIRIFRLECLIWHNQIVKLFWMSRAHSPK